MTYPTQVLAPYTFLTSTGGAPLDAGKVYIGVANLNPETNPITVYWDKALTQPAAQPILTSGGYLMRAGTPARIYSNTDYSITVKDREGRLMYTAATSAEPIVAPFVPSFKAGTPTTGYDPEVGDFTGSVSRTFLDKAREVVSFEDFGAVGDGITDDTASITAAVASGAAVVNGTAGKVYLIKNRILPGRNQILRGNNSTLKPDYSLLGYNGDIFYMTGSNSLNSEAKNILIEGWKVVPALATTVGFGVQVNGESFTYKPSNVTIRDNSFINCPLGGVFINSATFCTVSRNFVDGGFRTVGTKAPIATPSDCSKILISENMSINTTQYGIQTYYGYAIVVANNIIDGSKTISGDLSCITIDRTTEATVIGNSVRNAANDQIFVTGVKDVTVTGNTCVGGKGGIQVCYNFEDVEDPDLKESVNVTVTGNAINFTSDRGIIFNGVQRSTITSNSIRGGVGNAIALVETIRPGDSYQSVTSDIAITANVCERGYFQSTVASGGLRISVIANLFASYGGTNNNTILMNNDGLLSLRFGNKPLENFGLLKREAMSADQWLMEFRLADESFHKGFVQRYLYGDILFQDSAGVGCFRIGVGEGTNKKDIATDKAGAGLIVKSPNGLVQMRIGIDNTGAIVTSAP